MNIIKLLITFLFFLTFVVGALSQGVDYDKIIIPKSSKSVEIEERLVQLAWQNHPSNRKQENQIEVARYNLMKSKWDWLNQIRIAGNVNEFTINPDDGDQLFFPRYNFSASFPLGIFLDQPANVKIARENYNLEQQEIMAQKLALRSEVLSRYEKYQREKEVLDLLTEILAETRTQYSNVESDVTDGLRPLEDRYKMGERLKRIQIERIKAEANLKVAKLELEEMIGIKLEEVLF